MDVTNKESKCVSVMNDSTNNRIKPNVPVEALKFISVLILCLKQKQMH